jgi:hypothetical protein
MSLQDMTVNLAEAYEFVSSISDPTVKKLLEVSIAKVVMRFVQWKGITDEIYNHQLPIMPFDMLFYVTLLESLFSSKERIQQALAGDLTAIDDFPGL